MSRNLMLDSRAVATALGISPACLYKQAQRQDLPFPAYRIGDLWKFKRAEVEAFFGEPVDNES